MEKISLTNSVSICVGSLKISLCCLTQSDSGGRAWDTSSLCDLPHRNYYSITYRLIELSPKGRKLIGIVVAEHPKTVGIKYVFH